MANSLTSRQQHEAPSGDDESSWTSYIQEFLEMEGTSNDRGGGAGGANSFTVTSDAGPCVASRKCKELMFRGGRRRRRRGRKAAGGVVGDDDEDDDDLKDTASSPVNSPKVSFSNNLEIMSRERKEEDSRKRSKVAEEGMELSGRRYDYTELKKKGLCLVPVSMLIDYLK